jgi:hypothetical protein
LNSNSSVIQSQRDQGQQKETKGAERKKTRKEMKIKEIQLKFFIAQSLTLLLQENYTSQWIIT